MKQIDAAEKIDSYESVMIGSIAAAETTVVALVHCLSTWVTAPSLLSSASSVF